MAHENLLTERKEHLNCKAELKDEMLEWHFNIIFFMKKIEKNQSGLGQTIIRKNPRRDLEMQITIHRLISKLKSKANELVIICNLKCQEQITLSKSQAINCSLSCKLYSMRKSLYVNLDSIVKRIASAY